MKNRKKKQGLAQEFKKFIKRGNVLDMATGIIIGGAFTAIVTSLVNDIIMPLISRAINFDLTSAKWILREEVLDEEGEVLISQLSVNYGSFIQYIINFFIIAVAIFLAIKSIQYVHNGYVKSQIKYIKKLKVKHPEYFDEDDEFGTLLYEKLKKEHPEEFMDEIVDEIEEQKEQAQEAANPIDINNELLERLNDNLEKMYSLSNKDNATEPSNS